VLGVPELGQFSEDDARTRREEIVRLMVEALQKRTTAEWLGSLGDAGIWHAPVNDYEAVSADPQVRHNGNLLTVPGATGTPITLVRHPVRYDGEAPGVRLPPQPLGAQSREILRELGYGEAAIEDMIAQGVVAAAPPGAEATAGR
jgi:crotonobetainyl-CoA:carnitine CoA-transferase CaiB-like acyl-CoA transferase